MASTSQATGLRARAFLRTAISHRPVLCKAGGGSIMREVLTAGSRLKIDGADDRNFYDMPRFVKHVDDGFLSGVTELYRQRIKPGGDILDLMSSWVSHLPNDVVYGRIAGHGMNAAELAKNPQLDEFFVRNLNMNPDGWAAEDNSFDAVVCCVSVQYLQKPELVFKEIYRVLRPGGVCIMTFSNRMFYTKAVAAWRESSEYGRCQLVKQYFQCIEGFTPAEVLNKAPTSASGKAGRSPVDVLLKLIPGGSLLESLIGRTSTDPFYAVIAYKDFKPDGSA